MRKFEITADEAAGIERAAQWHELRELDIYRNTTADDGFNDEAQFHQLAAEQLRALIIDQAAAPISSEAPGYQIGHLGGVPAK